MEYSEAALRAVGDELASVDEGLGPAGERGQSPIAQAGVREMLVPLWSVEECGRVVACKVSEGFSRHTGEDGLRELWGLGAIVEVGREPEL